MINIKNQKNNSTRVVYISLIISLFSYIVLELLGDFRSNISSYFFTLIPIYVAYLAIVLKSLRHKESAKYEFSLIIFCGLLFRLLLINSDPILSDDVYRYLWDGKVFAHSINPFAYVPADPILSHLKDTFIFPYINFPDIPTVYPPVSQFIFALVYWLGYNLIVWKIILLIFEVVLVLFLYRLINHFSMNPVRLSIYYLNPIVIIETYHSGHLDIIGVCFLMIGIYYFYKNKTIASIFSLILAILVKYKPLLFILPFLKKRFLLKLSIILGSIFVVLIPFSLNGIIPTAGIISYTNRWEFNGFFYKTFIALFDWIGFEPKAWFSYAYSGRVEDFFINAALFYKLTTFLIILFILADQFKKLKLTENFKGANYLQSGFFVCASVLLLSPTLYPWYLIWLIPFLIFIPNWSWIFFTMLIQLSYFVLQDYTNVGVWQESTWVLIAQYIPFYSLLLFEYLDRRKIKGWFL